MSDLFWFDSPSILINPERLHEFFPCKDFTIQENLNAIVRFSFYLGVILFVYKRDFAFFYIPIVTLIVTYIVSWSKKTLIDKEKFQDMFTPNNPMGNYLIGHKLKFQETGIRKKPMENWTSNTPKSNKLKEQIKKWMTENTYKQVWDIYPRDSWMSRFYTMPDNGDPNNRERFNDFITKDITKKKYNKVSEFY